MDGMFPVLPSARRVALLAASTLGLANGALGQGQAELSVTYGHADPVEYMVYSQDGRFVATGSGDESAVVWDTRTGAEYQRFHRADLLQKILQYAQADKEEKAAQILLGIKGAMPIGFTADGKALLTAHRDQVIKVWSMQTGEELRSISVWPSSPAVEMNMFLKKKTPLGTITVPLGPKPEGAIEDDGFKRVFNFVSGIIPAADRLREFLFLPETGKKKAINQTILFAATRDMKFLLVGNSHGIETLSLPDLGVLSTYKPHGRGDARFVRSLSVTPDGKRAVAVLATGRIEVFDPLNGDKPIASERTYEKDVSELSLSANGARMAIVDKDGEVRVFNLTELKREQAVFTMAPVKGQYVLGSTHASLSPDGERVYISNPRTINFTGFGFKLPPGLDSGVDLSVTCGYTVADAKLAFKMSGLSLEGCVFSSDGRYAIAREYVVDLSTPPGSKIIAKNVRLGIPLELDFPPTLALSEPNLAAYSPGGRTVIVRDAGPKAFLCDRVTGLTIFNMERMADPIQSLMQSSAGLLLADGHGASSMERSLRLMILNAMGKSKDDEVEDGADALTVLRWLSPPTPDPNDPRNWTADSLPEFQPPISPRVWKDGAESLTELVATGPATIRRIDPTTSGQGAAYVGHVGMLQQAVVSEDGAEVVSLTRSMMSRVFHWDLQTGRRSSEFGDLLQMPLCIDRKGKRVVVLRRKQDKDVLKFVDVALREADGTFTPLVKKAEDAPAAFVCAPDSESVLCVYPWKVRRYTFASKKFTKDYGVHAMAVSDEGRFGVVWDGKAVQFYDFELGKGLGKLAGQPGIVHALAVNKDGTKAIVAYSLKKVSSFDVATGQKDRDFEGHQDLVTAVAFDSNPARAVTAGLDCTARVWDASTGREIVRFIPLAEREWVVVTRDNYYMSSRGANVGLSFRYGGHSNPFEQFDLKYNRPDKVLKALGSSDQRLVALYEQAYKRRLERQNLTEQQLEEGLTRPTVSIENREAIRPVVKDKSLTLAIKADAPSGRTIGSITTWVNDVPTVGSEGRAGVSGKSSFSGPLSPITLCSGPNKVQVAVTDSAGTTSILETLYVQFDANVPKTLWVLAIGVSKYAEPGHDLSFAAKDATDLAAAFRRAAGPAFAAVKVLDPLTDAGATASNIKAAAKALQAAGPDDTVVLTIAGHGMIDDQKRYLFGTNDVQFKPAKGGLYFDDIVGLLGQTPARRRLILMDTCFAGERDPSSSQFAMNGLGTMAPPKLAPGVRSISAAGGDAQLGLDNALQAMQVLFADLNRGIGAHIIAASGGMQFAMEDSGNGVFTRAVLEALQDPAVAGGVGELRVSQLRDYVYRRVGELTKTGQMPTSRQENLTMDFRLR